MSDGTLTLRMDEWDLIVLALEHVVARLDQASNNDVEKIHRLARKVTRRRCAETMKNIEAKLPEAGK